MRRQPRSRRARLTVTPLEGRAVPANFSIADGDVAALIDAVNQSNTNADALNTIALAANGRYTLTAVADPTNDGNALPTVSPLSSATPTLAKTLTIVGNGATIERSNATGTPTMRLFAVIGTQLDPNTVIPVTLNLQNLTLQNGLAGTSSTTGVGGGGAALLLFDATVNLDGVTVRNNMALDGGGAFAVNPDTTLRVRFSAVHDNSSQPNGGLSPLIGGGAISNAGTVEVSNSALFRNTSLEEGGAINLLGGTVTVVNSTIVANSAPEGGGINVRALTNVSLSVGFSTIVGNASTGTGTAPFAGGIADRSTGSVTPDLRLSHTIVAGNSAVSGPNADVVSPNLSSATSDFNFIGNGTNAASLANGVNGNLVGSAGNVLDPRLSAFDPNTFNGGTTPNLLPQAGSPVINAGNPAVVSPPAFDQRGTNFPRIVGGRVDIGAVETGTPGGGGPPPVATGRGYTVASGGGMTARVSTFRADGTLMRTVQPFGTFTGGVSVATTDFNRDGTADVAVAAGFGGGPHVRVYDGATGGLLADFFAYELSFRGGASVAAADVNGDGTPDLLTGPGRGGGPRVRVFDGANGFAPMAGPVGDFMAFGVDQRGGVQVAAGDVNGDGRADVVVGGGTGTAPMVRVFDANSRALLTEQLAFDFLFRGGVNVAAGDVTGDGLADVVVTPGVGGGPVVRVFRGGDFVNQSNFLAYASGFRFGARVSLFDFNGDNVLDVLTAPGSSVTPFLRRFDARTGASLAIQSPDFTVFNPAPQGGMFVG